MQQVLVVLTGAGISAESGLKTFRDAGGLWEGYRIDEVATPEAWQRNPQLVLDFYNMRRREVRKAQPNAAHLKLAELEQYFDVRIITQNIDDLHERAGSSKVLHLHGEILKMRSSLHPELIYPIDGDINLGDSAEDGAQLRPHVVWFGEPVPAMADALTWMEEADIFAVIGTSLQVYPAAGLLFHLNQFRPEVPVYIIDQKIPDVPIQPGWHLIEQPATLGVAVMADQLLSSLQS
ncbi:NAD-dependent deacetylase [Thermoflavifilum aggregans]|uniref:protein acetyllysine N-acetyltransferase n=1 Tax=Thermoflavifilum aggregans TaxID=454188 RepID=A0A2M9CUK6_9BACT|nr:Sir2 family NAD-dependent protein deacetylase [Thermoflavifilum aggregans]PJJ75535.1 NAD-dependent deacetylase [Thermoflavifilum aggregans]